MSSVFLEMGLHVRNRDQRFQEAIGQQMRVPDRLRVGPGPQGEEERETRADPALAYSMHIPDRLSLADTPDLSPRSMFTSSSSRQGLTAQMEPVWETHSGTWDREAALPEPPQSPLRRSHSDQAFGRNPPVTPTLSKQVLHATPLRGTGRRPPQYMDFRGPSPVSPSVLTPQKMLQAVKELGQLASQRVLETVTQKCKSRFSYPEHPPGVAPDIPGHTEQSRRSGLQEWLNAEEDGVGSVEFLVLRRQVVKMSRRLAALERQNGERRQTELVLASLLLSACLINGWLWLRR